VISRPHARQQDTDELRVPVVSGVALCPVRHLEIASVLHARKLLDSNYELVVVIVHTDSPLHFLGGCAPHSCGKAVLRNAATWANIASRVNVAIGDRRDTRQDLRRG
jgi:hypothetical protein